jgi:hypothetical protein
MFAHFHQKPDISRLRTAGHATGRMGVVEVGEKIGIECVPVSRMGEIRAARASCTVKVEIDADRSV